MLSLRILATLTLSASAALASGASASSTANAGGNTITDIVIQSGGEFDSNRQDFDILLNAVVTADLADALADPTAELTVFAPNDRAFCLLARDLGFKGGFDEAGAWAFLVDALTGLGGGDPVPVLTDILLYHVAPGELRSSDLIVATLAGGEIDTLLGATITPFFLNLRDNDPDIRNPFVLLRSRDIEASNGRIHSLSRVLLPIDLP